MRIKLNMCAIMINHMLHCRSLTRSSYPYGMIITYMLVKKWKVPHMATDTCRAFDKNAITRVLGPKVGDEWTLNKPSFGSPKVSSSNPSTSASLPSSSTHPSDSFSMGSMGSTSFDHQGFALDVFRRLDNLDATMNQMNARMGRCEQNIQRFVNITNDRLDSYGQTLFLNQQQFGANLGTLGYNVGLIHNRIRLMDMRMHHHFNNNPPQNPPHNANGDVNGDTEIAPLPNDNE